MPWLVWASVAFGLGELYEVSMGLSLILEIEKNEKGFAARPSACPSPAAKVSPTPRYELGWDGYPRFDRPICAPRQPGRGSGGWTSRKEKLDQFLQGAPSRARG